jgi:curved DNA-binding protein CbpA
MIPSVPNVVFRDLAKRWHPDRHSPAERALAEVPNAANLRVLRIVQTRKRFIYISEIVFLQAEFKRVQQAYSLVTGRDRRPPPPRNISQSTSFPSLQAQR